MIATRTAGFAKGLKSLERRLREFVLLLYVPTTKETRSPHKSQFIAFIPSQQHTKPQASKGLRFCYFHDVK